MFQEVDDIVGLLDLEMAASIDPDTDGGNTREESRFGGDTETVGEGDDAGFRGWEDWDVVSEGRMGRNVAEEAGVRIFEVLDSSDDGMGEDIVVHEGGLVEGEVVATEDEDFLDHHFC